MAVDEETKAIVDARTGEITRRVRPFAEWLREHRRGELHDEIGVSLNELVQAVSIIRKPGKLTVTIEVKPVGKGRDTVIVSDNVDLRLPQADRDPALFFVDNEFNLVRNDPNQPELPFGSRPVPRPVDPPTHITEENKP